MGKIWSFIKQPKVYINAALIIIILAGGTIWVITSRNRHRAELQSRDVLIKALRLKWMTCVNAPADTIYVPVHIVLPPTGIIHPTPVRIIKPKPDTVGAPVKDPSVPAVTELECPRAYYNDTVRTDKYTVNFEALGCLKWYRILGITLDHDYMIVRRNHFVTVHDTAFLPAPVKRWRWGLEASVIADGFSTFPGGSVGAFVMFQEKLIIGAGPVYFNGFAGQIRLGYIIK